MFPVAIDGLVPSLKDGVGLVAGVELVVEAVLADQDDDERSGPISDPRTSRMVILHQFGSGMARFKPIFQSMITGMVEGTVDGLVVLEIGLKDDDKSAQLNDVAVLGHADGWAENAEKAVVEPALSHSQSELIS